MKKIFIILAFIFCGMAVKAQTNPFPTLDSLERFINRYIRNSAVESFQNLRMNTALIGMLRFVQNSEIGSGVDTAYAANDSTVRIITHAPDTFDVTLHFAGGGGGSGSNNTNIGVGYRWLNPGTQTLRTLFVGYGTIVDSTSNANGLTIRADTTGSNGLVTRSELRDSTDRTTLTEKPVVTRPATIWANPDTLALLIGWGLMRNASDSAIRADTSATGLATQYDLTQVTSGINQLTGDVTAGPGTGSQAATIPANTITTTKVLDNNITWAKIQTMAARSIFGNPTASTANGQEITASTDGDILRRSGTTLGFGSIASNSIQLAATRIPFGNGASRATYDSALAYNDLLNRLYSDSILAIQLRALGLVLDPNGNIIARPDSLVFFGDSYTTGVDASPADSAYVPRLIDYYDLPGSNHAVSGRGVWKMIEQHMLNINAGHNGAAFLYAMFNDVRRNGFNRKNLNKIINAYKAAFVNQYAASFTAGGSAGATRFGTWNAAYTAQAVGGKAVSNAATTSTVNDSITYAFSGTTVYWLGIGADNSGGGFNYTDSADVYIDNVFVERIIQNNQYDGVSDGSYDNRRGPMGWYYTGLSAGAHVIKIINRHSGNFLVVDGFGTLVSRADAFPMYWFHATYNTVAGFAVSPANGSVAGIDSANAKMDSLWATLPTDYPVYIVPTDQCIDTVGGDMATDQIHPSNQGHRKIALCAIAAHDLFAGAENGRVEYDGTYFYGTAQGIRRKFATTEIVPIDTNSWIKKSPASIQTGYFNLTSSTASNITGTLTIGNSAASGGTVQFRIRYGVGLNQWNYGFSSRAWQIFANDALTDGVNATIMADNIDIAGLVGSASTTYVTFSRTGTYAINVTGRGITNTAGNNLFNSTSGYVGIGGLGAGNRKLYVNGSIGMHIDSSETITSLGSDFVQVIDATTGKFKKITGANLGTGGGITGSGTSGQATYWNGTSSITGDANYLYSASNAGTLSIGTTTTLAHLNIGGNKNFDGTGSSTGWGVGLNSVAATFTDNVTAASGTTNFVQNYLQGPTLAATNATVTSTNPTTFRVDGPIPGTNVSFTGVPFAISSFGALWVNGATKTVVSSLAHNSGVTYSNSILLCDASGANYNLNLPSATTYGGVSFTFKRTDASGNTCTITRAGSDTIDGATSYSLTAQYKYVKIVSDGTNWLIIANN